MLGIYVHIPFCIRKCNYCDFASYPAMLSRQDEYIDALIAEMKLHNGAHADTVYIGGGTPSALTGDNLTKLLAALNENFSLSFDTEFTVEVNPGTVDIVKARILKKYGVNRISIGSQTFCDSELEILGRIHTSRDTINTYELLRNCGFDNISLDLMYALPSQTLDSLNDSIDMIFNLNPEHVSCYGLKLEPGTPFHDMLANGKLKECDEDTFADMYEQICSRLKQNGYVHYEISNFAREGMQSRHNLKYWNCEDYIGLGLGAASCEDNHRYTHTTDFDDYVHGCALAEDYHMTKSEAMSEFVILGLRVLNSGVDKQLFYERFGESIDEVFSHALLRVSPYVINTETSLKLKEEAALVSNSVMCEFMS